jgi:hypothetical protein
MATVPGPRRERRVVRCAGASRLGSCTAPASLMWCRNGRKTPLRRRPYAQVAESRWSFREPSPPARNCVSFTPSDASIAGFGFPREGPIGERMWPASIRAKGHRLRRDVTRACARGRPSFTAASSAAPPALAIFAAMRRAKGKPRWVSRGFISWRAHWHGGYARAPSVFSFDIIQRTLSRPVPRGSRNLSRQDV